MPPQRSLAWAYSLSGPSLVSAPVEVAALDLLWQRSLAQAYFGGGCWLRSNPAGVPDLVPVPQTSLAWACSFSSHSPVLAPVEVTASIFGGAEEQN